MAASLQRRPPEPCAFESYWGAYRVAAKLSSDQALSDSGWRARPATFRHGTPGSVNFRDRWATGPIVTGRLSS